MIVSCDTVMQLAAKVLARAGVPDENAQIVIRMLVEAELRGLPSHGLLRLPRIVERAHNGVLDPRTTGRHTWTSPTRLSTDGQRGIGQVVAHHALLRLSERVQETGLAMASISNNNHIGMLALYAEDVARRGQVLIGTTTSEALVHPWNGRRAMIGTNPIAIGVPTDTDPFVLDMATSLVSMGKIHDHAHRGEMIPDGWALDAAGNPTNDPVAAQKGAIAPFGGAKGYALGLALEVLVASLTDSAMGPQIRGTLDSTDVCNKGDVFIVATPTSSFEAIGRYLTEIRGSASLDGDTQVLVPGDRARRAREVKLRDGIDVQTEVWERLNSLA